MAVTYLKTLAEYFVKEWEEFALKGAAGKADESLNLFKTFTTRPMYSTLRCTDIISFRTVVTNFSMCKKSEKINICLNR